jgi:hypothetical protein
MTTLTTAFTQPDVGSTVTAVVGSNAGIVVGEWLSIAGGGYYIATAVSGTTGVTLLNTNNPVNAPPAASVLSGATVTIFGTGDSGSLVAPANGQVLQVQAGAYTPAGLHPVINVASFGAVGDANLVGADDWEPIQKALDSVALGHNMTVLLPESPTPYTLPAFSTMTCYCVSEPLVMNDKFVAGAYDTLGNSCKRLRGESRDSVAIIPSFVNSGSVFDPDWLGPLIIVGSASDTGSLTTTTQTTVDGHSMVVANNVFPPVWWINWSEYDTGNMKGLGAFCFEMWYNPTTDVPATGLLLELAASFGSLGSNTEQHQAFYLRRNNNGSQNYVSAALCLTNGGGTTTTTGSQTMPATNVATTVVFGSTVNMSAGLWLTIAGIGTLVVKSVTDTTHAVVINYGYTGNVVAGTPISNGTAVGIEGLVVVSTMPGHDVSASALQHIAVDYDGSHLRLWINGAQPDTSMTVACTGTIIQKWYEIFTTGSGSRSVYPEGPQFWASGIDFYIGVQRKSDISRYTSAFTPSPSSVTCDSGCALMFDFAAQTPASNANVGTIAANPTAQPLGCFPGTTTPRPSLQNDFIIGRSGVSRGLRARSNTPVWCRLHITQVPYTNRAEISHLCLSGNWTHGIFLSAATDSYLHHLQLNLLQSGITFDCFSYGSTWEHINFVSTGSNLGSYNNWNIGLLVGSQFMTQGDGIYLSDCQTDWHLVQCSSDCTVGKCYLTGNLQGSFALMGDSSFVSRGMVIDDEDGRSQYAGVLVANMSSVRIFGGWMGSTGNAPLFKIANSKSIAFDGVGFNALQPLFSFYANQNNGVPIMWASTDENGYGNVIDALWPGPVMVPQLELFGELSLTHDSAYSLAQYPPEAFYRYYNVSGLTAGRTYTWPANAGKWYEGRNASSQTLTLASLSGAATVSVTAGTTWKVRDNGTGLVTAP